jgi:hypothetical protein
MLFYKTATGNEFVHKWLKGVPSEERNIIGNGVLTGGTHNAALLPGLKRLLQARHHFLLLAGKMWI